MEKPLNELDNILEYIETNIETRHICYAEQQLAKALNYQRPDIMPLKIQYPITDFQPFTFEEIHEDIGKMMYNELIGILNSIILKDYGLPMIRANYGVGTLASLFGVESKIVDNNMPWVCHVNSIEKVKAIIKKGSPKLDCGFGQKLIDTQRFYIEKLSHYPKCSQAIKVYHPDLQGPLDTAHMIVGSDIYIELYQNPGIIKDLLELVTETYIRLMRELKKNSTDENDEYFYHWQTLYKGKILLRDDTAVNISKEMYEEFSRPYNDAICEAFGSGAVHYCGKHVPWIESMLSIPNCTGLNIIPLPNQQYGEEFLQEIMTFLRPQKLYLAFYHMDEDEIFNLNMDKFNTGFSLVTKADSEEEAKRIMDKYNVFMLRAVRLNS
ncbi:MAG: hypothetical protein A2Y10_19915 [Planctomycetes bacterium GWF2_41_51]|nr:MAG: hypothetical protein A2Y10_19915 [Planctomycetes bacterium GWF2_41_51]HBG28552.1 hypothetical protein [Phycisphaerales bacterium]